ncbi:DEAD/DEAH box helicase [Carpediemonas membranifera]|uniref:RNA helicase n=1 Tax=Carpediemonas membranifera TaxID=201153 RepID=A0A8J6E296_9EUKA|nr:DEAD/DEAH box helicase [Carpediemonas membranifera]|eukprot:KAG9391642.1 DEAD/DEAH box helicase [Carpediemonas membranifera]
MLCALLPAKRLNDRSCCTGALLSVWWLRGLTRMTSVVCRPMDPWETFCDDLDANLGADKGVMVGVSASNVVEYDPAFRDVKQASEAPQSVSKAEKKQNKLKLAHRDIPKLEVVPTPYREAPSVVARTDEEVEAFRASHSIEIDGTDVPHPIKRWDEAGLISAVLHKFVSEGWKEPTAIQCQALPVVMTGRNLIGIAETGSGKTLAFVLPMLRHVAAQTRSRGRGKPAMPVAVILSPTRELAQQISDVIEKFVGLYKPEIRLATCIGGDSIDRDIGKFKAGVDIVCATPGRLVDILTIQNCKVANLHRASFVVLDEADRMFDQGFGQQVKTILRWAPKEKQTVMFSATFPREMEILARDTLVNPTTKKSDYVRIRIGGVTKLSPLIQQHVKVVEHYEKMTHLAAALREHVVGDQAAIVFVNEQTDADKLFQAVKSEIPDIRFGVSHGGKIQEDREAAMEALRTGETQVLIATSVAARGIDVDKVRLVFNYAAPDHLEDYVHRCGRTGRAGTKGVAITMVTAADEASAEPIAFSLADSGVAVPHELWYLVAARRYRVAAGHAKKKHSGFEGRGFKFSALEQRKVAEERQKKAETADIEVEELETEQPKKKHVAREKTFVDRLDPALLQTANDIARRLAEESNQEFRPIDQYRILIPAGQLDTTTRGSVMQAEFKEELSSKFECNLVLRGTYISGGTGAERAAAQHFILTGRNAGLLRAARDLVKERIGEVQAKGGGRYSFE